jgi:hypothetical protein
MLRIEDSGDTWLIVGKLFSAEDVREANTWAKGSNEAKTTKPKLATYQTLLLGITKVALQSESFLSRASFQETTKVLTEAALAGATDELRGLKENVILGHLIPAGTGFHAHQRIRVAKLVDAPEDEAMSDEAFLAEARDEAEELVAESPAYATTISQATLADLNESLRAAVEDASELVADEEPSDGILQQTADVLRRASIEVNIVNQHHIEFAIKGKQAGVLVIESQKYVAMRLSSDINDISSSQLLAMQSKLRVVDTRAELHDVAGQLWVAIPCDDRSLTDGDSLASVLHGLLQLCDSTST